MIYKKYSQHNTWKHLYGVLPKISAMKRDIELHGHDYYEVDYLHEGNCINFVNGAAIPMAPGDFSIHGPHDAHMVQLESPQILFYNIAMRPSEIPPAVCRLLEDHLTPLSGTLNENDRTLMEMLFWQLYGEVRTPSAVSKELVTSFTTAMLSLLYRSNPIVQKQMQNLNHTMHNAFVYINEHFRENITVEDVAQKVGLSSSYFSTFFHQNAGWTFKKYISFLRLQYAQKLLDENHDMDITYIAYESGFGSYSNFSRAFKSRWKMSPTEYRSAMQDKK